MKIGLVLADLHGHERNLARELLAASERHHTDHEIHHLARDLAGWSRRHLTELTSAATRYGLDLDPEPDRAHSPYENGVEPLDRCPDAGLLLLHDLRNVHVQAAEVSVDWTMLGQAAQASNDTDLLSLVQRCHPDTLRQMRWALAHIKTTSAQILLS